MGTRDTFEVTKSSPPTGRRDHAQREVVDHDHGEMNGINAQFHHHRRKNRRQFHHPGQQLYEDAEKQQENVDEDEEHPRRQIYVDDYVCQQLRQAFNGKNPGEGSRQANDDQHRGRQQRRARQDVGQGFSFQRSVSKLAADQCIENGYHRGFYTCKNLQARMTGIKFSCL